jgi:N-acetylglucosaminyldiphosphoundecaprenol N-acetyl-beta-D-mannosaminyltransferase
VGVGGSFDVLSNTKSRAPKLFIRLNLEWLYRILREPSRLKRFYQNNVRFLFRLRKLK